MFAEDLCVFGKEEPFFLSFLSSRGRLFVFLFVLSIALFSGILCEGWLAGSWREGQSRKRYIRINISFLLVIRYDNDINNDNNDSNNAIDDNEKNG